MSKGHPMRITASLRCAVQSDPYLPIDGILHAALLRETFGAEEVTIPGDMAQFGGGHTGLPLKRIGLRQGEPWFYAASFAEWSEPRVDDRSFWVKRFDIGQSDLIDFGGRVGSVLVASGRYKGYNMPVFVRHALCVRWYAVGSIERVRELLGGVTHIGKKGAQGWGRVNGWEVEPWEHDWSVWRGQQLMRAIPAAGGTLYGVRPPYWRASHQTPCRLPAVE